MQDVDVLGTGSVKTDSTLGQAGVQLGSIDWWVPVGTAAPSGTFCLSLNYINSCVVCLPLPPLLIQLPESSA